MEEKPPYWVLISVLFSSQPLSSGLALTLHEAALELYRKDETEQELLGDLVHGRITNLRQQVALGAITGPAFEAKVDTERGTGTVRFLLTREGLELANLAANADAHARPKYLN